MDDATQAATAPQTATAPAHLVVRSKKKKLNDGATGVAGQGPTQGATDAGPVDEATAAPLSDKVKVIPISKNHEFFQEGWRPVQLSVHDKAPGMSISEDGLSVTSHKGYRTARATHGAYSGSFYFEVHITHLAETGHCRVGWTKRKAELQAPVGYDAYGYSYRDLEGTKVHKAFREPYGEPYQEGDTIGCVIHLPPGGRALELNKEDIVWWKGQPFLKDETATEPMPLQGSFLGFCRNGVWQGKAYETLMEGTYYPAVALYTLPHQAEGATLTLNFGPDFKHGLPSISHCPDLQAISTLAGTPSE